MGWIKKNRTTLILVVLILTGIGLIAYPTLSNLWYSKQQSESITAYVENESDGSYERSLALLEEADAHNEEVGKNGIDWVLSEEEMEEYNAYLKMDESDIMSYIEIPAIDCMLPIYHGVSEAVLQVGVGHMEGSSLPVGGASSHCVLSGHCGLPSARLFTDLDQLKEGDQFTLHTLGRTLIYEVDQISVVEPTDFSKLQIEEGKDYCTLITCTPYGINSHRLLVRGKRALVAD